ncbi:hypothetical protein [Nostoc sp. NZL]|uniref:hypothetical protein n=1 Tax=Nostoc sp. NZL TaxID=2650612 RepID=UPI0018C63A65|nr:hypothetical protein [Nostoc sp. NZL]
MKKSIFQTFHECCLKTFALFQDMNETTFCSQPHPDLSGFGSYILPFEWENT